MKPQTAREICLNHAANLLYRSGYHCVDGLRILEIIKQLQQLGDTHITDKFCLTLEVMEFIHHLEKQHLFHHMSASIAEDEKLSQLLENMYTYMTEYDYLTLMIQLSHLSQKPMSTIHVYCRYYFKTWEDALTELLVATHGNNARSRANHMVLMVIGANALNRVDETPMPAKTFMTIMMGLTRQ